MRSEVDGRAVARAPEELVPFAYDLPADLIAQEPALERADARLMLVARGSLDPAARDAQIRDLPGLLRRGDLLVVNRSRVLAARLLGQRVPGGGESEILLVAPRTEGRDAARAVWRALGRPARRLEAGRRLRVGEFELEILARDGPWLDVAFPRDVDVHAVLARYGEVPLPPYIHRDAGATEADRVRYQTVFAREPGSVAAPTAGLHLTSEILAELGESGVGIAEIVLHVGPATFLAALPGRTPTELEPEPYRIPAQARTAIAATQARGGRVVAVGTTTTRALESAAAVGWPEGWQSTQLLISPGHTFRVVAGLLTNFHLPGTSLLALVAAFAGTGCCQEASAAAVRRRDRFDSYGDAMLIL